MGARWTLPPPAAPLPLAVCAVQHNGFVFLLSMFPYANRRVALHTHFISFVAESHHNAGELNPVLFPTILSRGAYITTSPAAAPSPHSEAMNTSSSPPSSPAASAVAGWAKRRLLGVSCLLACWRSPPPSPRSPPRPRWIKLRGIKMLICCHGAKKKESGRVRACLCVCTLQRGS